MTKNNKKHDIQPADGKLGVLLPGMGAVTSTFIAGVELFKKGLGQPIGSATELARIRLGKRYERRNPLIKEFVPLTEMKDLVFGGWDIFSDDMSVAAAKAGVLPADMLRPIEKELSDITPMPASFDPSFIKNLSGTNVKKGT